MRLLIIKIWKVTFQKLWYMVFKNSPLTAFGKLIYPFVSKSTLQKAIKKSFESYSVGSIFSEMIMAGYNEFYKNLSDLEKEKINRDLVWGKNAVSWNYTKQQTYSNDINGEFLEQRKYIFDFIDNMKREGLLLNDFSMNEIGTGNGMTLSYMQDRYEFVSYTGLDINQEIINNNIEKFKNINFYCEDANDYFNKNFNSNIFIITIACLMYFQQSTLERLLMILSNNQKHVVFAINEPVVDNYYELEESVQRDRFQLTHNYPELFKKYNFKILLEKLDNGRLTCIAKLDNIKD